FVGDDVSKIALAVNAMSGLLSAATIPLLFWSITHLVKKLTVSDDATEINPVQMLLIFGSGLCGALMYAWSDTFWFSAVEGEVYAFSSFCTALVFWLILKWENCADQPHSDQYLILIAYILGISIGVHLLNLLCIPAIVLVFYYRKWRNTSAKGSLIALGVSFVIVALVLYGLVPGFVKMAQYFDLFFVNVAGLSYNTGVLIYAVAVVAVMALTIRELYLQRSARRIRVLFPLAVIISGIPLMFHSLWLAALAAAALYAGMFIWKRPNVRILNVSAISMLVIFIGYSSYALLLVRSNAATPMNQNAPDNVFALSSYLNREQYGDRPLFYGNTPNSQVTYQMKPGGGYQVRQTEGDPLYSKAVKNSPDEPDRIILTGHKKNYVYAPELNMVFPRIYSSDAQHKQAYTEWINMQGTQVPYVQLYDIEGNPMQETTEYALKPTFAESMKFFFSYQLNHMYWRYFMWNFAGRQNDIQGNGEVNHGNWISGIPFIDNPRLGDQSLLPYDDGEGNKGHNVFFMLPLIMGIIGLLWQAFVSKRGIEQFWVVFFLFFMTGIAIVIYLNQTPLQPRERDYAFAGSFYAFAIWVGMGVAGIRSMICSITERRKPAPAASATGYSVDIPVEEPETPEIAPRGISLIGAIAGVIIGIIVPLQVVSQTWDDHDRSGRY
ncbi:MAG: DUF2723 domain-containing protein, partial [Paramuribaculum sp.]|nr:DUF2723 domain-containing protein [Paramuribaculum sp.]